MVHTMITYTLYTHTQLEIKETYDNSTFTSYVDVLFSVTDGSSLTEL